MNVKLLLLLFVFVFQFSFSQTEKLLKGVVSSDSFLLYNVDVINKTSKQYTKTNQKGEFEIAVQANDSLLFYSKSFYLKRLKIYSKQIEMSNLEVILIKKPEELEEVLIAKKESIKLSKDKNYEQKKLNEYATEKFDNRESHQAIRNGTLVNGLNFKNIAKKIMSLLSKEKEPKKGIETEIDFATLAKSTCDLKFFTENLKLKPEQIGLFLQFCDSDPKSKKVKENTNILSMMDFLAIKNSEFQKLK